MTVSNPFSPLPNPFANSNNKLNLVDVMDGDLAADGRADFGFVSDSDKRSASLKPHAVSAAPTPALGITWAGPSSQLAAGDPPDCNIAAGTSDIITVINSRIDIYSKTGTQLYDQTFQTFFNLPSNEFMFDPRVAWDQYSNRYIMTAADENGGSSQAFLDIAVSK